MTTTEKRKACSDLYNAVLDADSVSVVFVETNGQVILPIEVWRRLVLLADTAYRK